MLTVHPNIIIVFFTNLMHKFFILLYSLYPSTCFEHYYAHPEAVKLYYSIWYPRSLQVTLQYTG